MESVAAFLAVKQTRRKLRQSTVRVSPAATPSMEGEAIQIPSGARGGAALRSAARVLLQERGFRDRRTGNFAGVPPTDLAEPMRTERLLAQPFSLRRVHTGDDFQSREGFFAFR